MSEARSLLQRLWCRLVHWPWHDEVHPIYHSYAFRCRRCGHEFIVED